MNTNSNEKNKKYQIPFDKLPSSLLRIRSRIHRILDQKLYQIYLMMQKFDEKHNSLKNNFSLALNESKLQEWTQIFSKQIVVKPDDLIVNDNVNKVNLKRVDNIRIQNQKMERLQFAKPFIEFNSKYKVLYSYSFNENKLNIFKIKEGIKHQLKENNIKFDKVVLEFKKGFLKKFSSITFVDKSTKIIFIGGCKQSNPNIKSSSIHQFNLKTAQLKLIAKLPYGLSSHSAIFDKNNNQVFIIGGNKNHSVTTRGCFKLSLFSNYVTQISCLNYPAMAMNCIQWKSNWIYKFGGIGEAFGNWNTSPYIQRYSILENQWEVINPKIPNQLYSQSIFSYMFLAKSDSYICQNQNQIFVFGGYNFQGQSRNYGFVLKIENQNQNNKSQHDIENDGQDCTQNHTIAKLGQIECKIQGIYDNQIYFNKNHRDQISMYVIQANFIKQTQSHQQQSPIILHQFT